MTKDQKNQERKKREPFYAEINEFSKGKELFFCKDQDCNQRYFSDVFDEK